MSIKERVIEIINIEAGKKEGFNTNDVIDKIQAIPDEVTVNNVIHVNNRIYDYKIVQDTHHKQVWIEIKETPDTIENIEKFIKSIDKVIITKAIRGSK
jgi:hypothetical protein